MSKQLTYEELEQRVRELEASQTPRTQSLLTELIESIQAGVMVHGRDGALIKNNTAAQTMLGLTHEQMLGKALHDPAWTFLRKDGSPLPVEQYPVSQAIATKTPIRNRVMGIERSDDAEPIWVLTTVIPEFDENDHITQLVSTLTDISALKKSEERYRNLFEHTMHEIHLWKLVRDEQGAIKTWRLVEINPPALRSWNKTRSDIIGKTPEEIFSDEAREQFMPIVEKIFAEGKPYTWEAYFPPTVKFLYMTSIPFGEYFISTGEDITHLKKTEEALKASEERHRLFNNPTFGGSIIHDQGRILDCSSGITNVTGYSYDELIGMDGLLLIAPDWRDFVTEKIASGFNKPYEAEGIRKDGTHFPLRLHATGIQFHGKPARVVEFRDITELRQKEEALRESEALLRKTDRLAKIGGWSYDLQNEKLTWTKELYDIHEVGSDFVPTVEQGFAFYDADSRAIIKKAYANALADGAPYDLELKITTANNTEKHVKVIGEPQTDENGVVVLFSGVFQDITERKKAERALRQSEGLLRNVINFSTDYIFVKDTHLRTLLCNEKFAHSVNKKPSDLIGKTDIENGWDAELVKGNPNKGIIGYEKYDLEALRGNFVEVTETAMISGQMLFLDTVKIPLKDENDQIVGVLGRSRDITAQKRAEQALKASEERFRTLANTSPFPTVVLDATGETILHWSHSARELFGHRPQTPAEWFTLAYPDPHYRQQVIERSKPYLERARYSTTAVNTGEYQITCRDGSVKLCEIYAQSIADNFVLTNVDITERKQAERRRRLAASLFARTPNGVVIADREMRVLDINPSYVELTGFTKEELLGEPLERLITDVDGNALLGTLGADSALTKTHATEINARRKNSEPFPAMLTLAKVLDDEGEVQHYLMVLNDISTLKAQQIELDRLAHHDALTGLPNRRLLLDRLEQAIALADRTGGSVAVCYLDLDGFKPINDQHGHEVGDQYLIAVGGMLLANLRRHDSVARIGGDEFVLMLTELQCPKDACCAQLDRILAAIHEPVIFNGVRHQVSASIGVTLYPGDHADPERLLDHADQAMYRAKQSGGRCYQFYRATLN